MPDVPVLTENSEDQRRTETALIRSASTGAVLYQTVYGSIPALFLFKGLGARPFYVGLLATLCSLTTLGMLIGTVLVHRLGKVRLLMLGRLAGLLPVAGMIALAAIGERGPVITFLALLSCCSLALVMNIGTTSWWPLLQDNVPEATMGKFFARMRTRLRTVEIGVPLLLGFWLGKDPSARQFLLPFGLGTVGLLVGAHILRKLPERPATAPDVGLLLRLRLASRDRHVRSYMLFMAMFFGILSMSAPFWMVLLTNDAKNPFPGVPAMFVVWLSAVAAVGHMLSLKLWAYMVDHHGGRPASSLCLILSATAGLAWLALPGGGNWLYVWAVAFYFAWGVFEGGAMMGRTWSMMRSVPKAYQSDGFTLVMLAQAAGASLGALAGGTIFEALTQATKAGWRPGGMDPRAIYLCAAQLALLTAYLASRRLIGYEKQTPTREILRQAWERMVE